MYKNNNQFQLTKLQMYPSPIALKFPIKIMITEKCIVHCLAIVGGYSSKSKIERSAFFGVSFFGCFRLDDGEAKLALFLLPVNTQPHLKECKNEITWDKNVSR